jgi:hypothetical protein
VAGFTLELSVPERAARIGGHCVFGPKYRQGYFIVVAGNAGVSPLSAVGGIRCGLAGRLRSCNRRNEQARRKQCCNTSDKLQVHSNTISFQVFTAITQAEMAVSILGLAKLIS